MNTAMMLMMILEILTYPVEIGSTHTRLNDESEWIKIPDQHESIISIKLSM